ncbi:hypothetical protein GEMRC1_006607 [Eukaryota sp. GEM-RC1]
MNSLHPATGCTLIYCKDRLLHIELTTGNCVDYINLPSDLSAPPIHCTHLLDSFYAIVSPQTPSAVVFLQRDGNSSSIHATAQLHSHILRISATKYTSQSSLLCISAQTKIFLFTISVHFNRISLSLSYFADTSPNPDAAFSLTTTTSHWTLVHLGLPKSSIVVKRQGQESLCKESLHAQPISKICSHEKGGRMLIGTTSRSGRNIRIWKEEKKEILKISKDLKRGTSQATPFSLVFSHDAEMIALSTKKSSIHVFGVFNEFHSVIKYGSVVSSKYEHHSANVFFTSHKLVGFLFSKNKESCVIIESGLLNSENHAQLLSEF